MAISTAIKSAVTSAFSAMSSMETAVVLVRNNSNPTYNATTGAITYSSTSYSFNSIIVKYERNEIDGTNVLTTDSKMIFPQTRVSVTPKTTDTITISSVTWEIKSIDQDPASATWTIQIRKA